MLHLANSAPYLLPPVVYNNDHSKPISHMSDLPFYANFKLLLPICLSLLMLLALVAAALFLRKRSKCP